MNFGYWQDCESHAVKFQMLCQVDAVQVVTIWPQMSSPGRVPIAQSRPVAAGIGRNLPGLNGILRYDDDSIAMSGWCMFLTLILVFGLVSTPVATPVSLENTPDWTVPLGVPAAVEPLLTGDLVVIAGSDRTVIALDAATGELQWSAALNEEVGNPMVVAGDMILIPGAAGTLTAISAETGEFMTATSLGVDQLIEPVILNGTIVVSDARGTMSLLDAETLATQRSLVVPEGVTRIELAGDMVVVASDDGSITAVDIDQAAIRWQTVVSAPASILRIADDGNVLLGLSTGDMVMLAIDDGAIMWQQIYTNARTNDVAFTDKEILAISTGGDFLVLNPADGARIWQDVLPAASWFGSDRCEHQCFIAASDGVLTTYSVADMEIAPARVSTDAISVPPVANSSVAIVVSSRGDVSAWPLASQ